MNQNIIKEVLVRISSASPTLFKRLQALFFGLAGLIIVLIALSPLNLNLHGFEVYVNWQTVGFLLSLGVMNMLPVSDPNVLNKKVNGDEDFSDPDKPKADKP